MSRKKSVCMCVCVSLLASLSHTHTHTLKYPLFFSHNALLCLSSVCVSEGILHPSNSLHSWFFFSPLLILRLGPGSDSMSKAFLFLLNIKSSRLFFFFFLPLGAMHIQEPSAAALTRPAITPSENPRLWALASQ